MAYLIVHPTADGETLFATLDGARTQLGSGGWEVGVGTPIAHPSVAALHASIEAVEGGYKLVDKSGGRTFVKGRPVSSVILVEGIELRLGEVRVVFRAGERDAVPKTSPGLDGEDGGKGLPAKLWVVVLEPGGGAPRRVPFGREMLIGSSQAADLKLAHPTVSGRHARLTRQEDRLFLRSGGRNGTFVGGIQVESCVLPLGMPVKIGPFEWYVEGEAPASVELEEFHGIYSASANMRALFALIARVAQAADCSVVVQGENGTGKEATVRALHALSPRARGRLVALNCAAVPEHLLEAELFGALRGSYTGCVEDRQGLFVQADGGTLFLDEVGELSPSAQAKLLRALQERTVRPLGSHKEIPVDVRVVAATNRDLKLEMEAGRFREDLFYRLLVLSIEVPPLRERGDDAVLLFRHFTRLASDSRLVRPLSRAVEACLRNYRWPGNVRELRNLAKRLVFTRGTRKPLEPEELGLGVPVPAPARVAEPRPRGLSLEASEKLAIAQAMREQRGNRKAAAEQLGISATTLLKKLRDYGLEDEGK